MNPLFRPATIYHEKMFRSSPLKSDIHMVLKKNWFDQNEENSISSGLNFILPDSSETLKTASNLRVVEQEDLGFEQVYFNAVMHEELFKLGKSYGEDYLNRTTSFAFHSVSGTCDVHKTIIGVAAHLAYHHKIRSLIITCNSNIDQYSKHLGGFDSKLLNFAGFNKPIQALNFNGLHLIDYNVLLKQFEQTEISQLIPKIRKKFDVVFFETDRIEHMSDHPNLYYSLLHNIESMSFHYSFEKASFSATNKAVEYFKSYSIPLKGFVTNQDAKRK